MVYILKSDYVIETYRKRVKPSDNNFDRKFPEEIKEVESGSVPVLSKG